MAEKKEQQLIEGAADVASPRVKAMAKRYVVARREWLDAKPIKEDLRSKLIEKMQEDGVEKFTLDGADVIELTHKGDGIAVTPVVKKEE